MTNLTPAKWNIFEPTVIRDAINGRLGYQENFGTTYISGATQALALKQNPLDGTATEGDATLYIGTTNGGVYMRQYDYSTDAWSKDWMWVSEPTATDSGFLGNQGVGAIAISPDGSLIAVGRGNPSNYNAYTPNGPALQFGEIQSDGSINWLPTPFPEWQSGSPNIGNVRDMVWQQDGLYVSLAGSGIDAPFEGNVYLLKLDASAQLTEPPIGVMGKGYPLPMRGDAESTSGVFLSAVDEGIYAVDTSGSAQLLDSGSSGWFTVWQSRLQNGEAVNRLAGSSNPDDPTGQIVLVGWAKYTGGAYITHVDRLEVNNQQQVTAVSSLDFSNLAGSSQAALSNFYNNYSLAFDSTDATLNTIFVGGNQYVSSHPDGATPYSFTGGLIQGNFDTQDISAVFGPYADANSQLVPDSTLIGAPHADSRTVIYLQTNDGGLRLIQSDDGGIWQLVPSEADPDVMSWQSLNATGLHSLETVNSAWDARSNSLLQAFQDNAVSLGQSGDDYLHNIWQGDGNLALVDGALAPQTDHSAWGYLQSQKYMVAGSVVGLSLSASGQIESIEQLALTTNIDGASVQPVSLFERYALLYAGQSADNAPSAFPATVNPYRPGDVVLAGSSGLYETFIPNWSDDAQANAAGTLQVLPLIPFDTADRMTTAVSVGSSASDSVGAELPKPFFWDAMVAATWNAKTQQSVIWYRDAVSLDTAPRSLADVDSTFLGEVGLRNAATSNRVINDLTFQASESGEVTSLYYVEGQRSLRYLGVNPSNAPLTPEGDDRGAALVLVQGETIHRLPYADTAGLKELVKTGDLYGPTGIELLPAKDTMPAQLVVVGEHGLYASYLDAAGLPTGFEAMDIAGLPADVQYGSALMGLSYSADDDLLVAPVLGGGSFLYSRSGDIGSTPTAPDRLIVSDTTVPQNAAELLDKRGNPVNGNFAIELPATAFDAQGVAKVNFVIPDVALWKQHLSGVSLYQSVDGPFNLLDTTLASVSEELTFNDFATLRLGSFRTLSTAQALPTVVLPYEVELLNEQGAVVETVQASIDLLPNGTTPSFSRFTGLLPDDQSVFQARYSFGDGVDFQYLPFNIKYALPSNLPEGTEVFAFAVDGMNGQVTINGTTYLPTTPGYAQAALQKRLDPDTDISAGIKGEGNPLALDDLTALFQDDALSAFLATEGQYFGKTDTVFMPEIYGDGSPSQLPLIGIGVQYADGEVVFSTADPATYAGNVINFTPSDPTQGVMLDVGFGGIFAAQNTSAEIGVAKLGRMQSAVGFVRLDDLFGTIDGIAPGEAGYAEAALQRSITDGLDIELTQAYGTSEAYDLDGFIDGCYYASYITRDTTTAEQALAAIQQSSDPTSEHVLFSFDAANPDASGEGLSASIPFATDLIAFEDMPMIGDLDYNDIVLYYGGLV